MAVTGNLNDISLTSLVSINCNEMNQARLTIKHIGQEAAVFFDGGNIVHAALGLHEGEEAMYEILQWHDGEFELEQGVKAGQQSIHKPWSGLLLEGLHRLDEAEIEVDLEAVPVQPEITESENAVRILGAMDRFPDVEEVLLCRRGSQDTVNQSKAGWQKLSSLLMDLAEQIAETLNQSKPHFILLTRESDRVLIVPFEPAMLVVQFKPRSSVDQLLEKIVQLKTRYPLTPAT